MTLGNRIRELRRKVGMTQAQLGKRAGVAQATISDYENDVTRNHRADELMRIASSLNTTPTYLMDGTGPVDLNEADSDEQALIAAFNDLEPHSRAALIAAARAMKRT
jgi:transcriptional regulator with XRE-family HTH domain